MKTILIIATLLMSLSLSDKPITLDISDVYKKEDAVNLSEIAKAVKLIKLEFTPDAALSYIKEVILLNNYILICDVKSNLCLFDSDGKYIRHIGKIGRGPGEYSNIRCIDVDPQNEIIFILDNYSPFLLSYDIKGNFKSTIIPCRDKTSFCFLNGYFYFHAPINLVAYSDNSNSETFYQLSVYDSKAVLVKSLNEVNAKNLTKSKFIEDAFFTVSSEGEVLYNTFRDNKVFSLKGDSFDLKYLVEAGKSNKVEDNADFLLDHIYSANKYLFINFRYQNKPGLVLYDGVKLRSVDSNNGGTITDDIDGTGKLFFQLYFQGDYLIDAIYANKLYKTDISLLKSERIKSIRNSLNEHDNPILRIVTLK